MNASDKLDQISPALVAVQEKLRNPKVDSKATISTKGGSRFEYEYLSLPTLLETVRQAFKGVGLGFTQEVIQLPGGIGVVTRITHLSGQYIETGPLFLPVDGNPQDYGSAITYGRRYALSAAVGLAPEEDDDGARPIPRRVAPSGPEASAAPAERPPVESTGGPTSEPGGEPAISPGPGTTPWDPNVVTHDPQTGKCLHVRGVFSRVVGNKVNTYCNDCRELLSSEAR